jgi:hypothetical protein
MQVGGYKVSIRLQEIIEQSYNCRSYSGRGMNGRECLAFTCDCDVFYAIANILETCEDLDDVDNR